MTDHLKEAAAVFCARSEVWQYDIETDYTYASEPDYEIDIPTNTVLENITVLYVAGTPITRIADKGYVQPPTQSNGQPRQYTMYQNHHVRFFPTPDTTYAFQGRGVLKPSLSATGVEDFIYQTHGRCIAYGALSNVLMIPMKEWSNPSAGQYYRNMFLRGADEAKGRDSQRAANTMVQQRPFA